MTGGRPRKKPSHLQRLVSGQRRTDWRAARQPSGQSMMRLSFAAAILLALTALCASVFASPPLPLSPSPSPLHQRIDSLIEAAAIGPLAPLCTDADFVRRVYLDLT